jgi:hypothetical protein
MQKKYAKLDAFSAEAVVWIIVVEELKEDWKKFVNFLKKLKSR